jgi:hypothetical protein
MMGNHEFCELCEESNFHYGRPCDPVKVAQVQANAKAYEQRKQAGIRRLRLLLDSLQLKYEIDTYGRAIVHWDQLLSQPDQGDL